MPTVTDIQEQKRRKDRVSVFLDEEFWCGMNRFCLTDLSLSIGQSFSVEDQKGLESRIAENEALVYAVDLLTRRPRSEKMLHDKLEDSGYPESVILQVISRAHDLFLLNDVTYARSLAEGRRDSGWGRRQAADKLRIDGIDNDLAEETLDEVFTEDETAAATRALESRFSASLDHKDSRRAYTYLARRGFSSGAVREAIAALTAEETEDSKELEIGEAIVLLKRKYPRMDPHNRDATQKAYAFLIRRGLSFESAKEALRVFQEELEEN